MSDVPLEPKTAETAEHDQLRMWVARAMIAEDAHWVADVVTSSTSTGSGAVLALALGHLFARICYEGALALRSARIGIPILADLLNERHSATTTRTRHTVKVLDDTKKSEEDVLSELRAVHESVHAALMRQGSPLRRWLSTDLGLHIVNGSVVVVTTPTAFRLGLDVTDLHSMAGENLHEVVHEWGQTTIVLTAATGQPFNPDEGTLDFGNVKIDYRDRVTSRYLSGRFDSAFSTEEKLLLAMLEADLSTSLVLLPLTEHGHEMAVFRARVITLLHGLHALQRLLARHPRLESDGTRSLRRLLADAPTGRLLGRGGTAVRNRCMHYELRDPRIVLDPALPMAGIVEAVYPGATWEVFESDVLRVSERTVDVLRAWQPSRTST